MEDRLARMEVLLQSVTQHTQSPTHVHSPAISHGETNAAALARSPSMSQNRSRAISHPQVDDTGLERPQLPQDLQRTSSPGHGIGTVVHVASTGPPTAFTAACSNPAAYMSSPSREHGAAADSPGFRSLLSLASNDLELPSVDPQRPEIACSSVSREPISTPAQAGAYLTPAPITIADAPTEGPGRSEVTGRNDIWTRGPSNIVVEQPVTPPSLAVADENDKALELCADAPCDEVRVGLVG